MINVYLIWCVVDTGQAGDTLYVLLCCWLAAVGAGLLKTEEILEGVARLRVSNDIEFEEQTFIALMDEAREVSNFPMSNLHHNESFQIMFSIVKK